MQGQPCTLQARTGQASTLYGQAVKAVCANPTGTDANFHGASLQMQVCLALRTCLGIPAFFPDMKGIPQWETLRKIGPCQLGTVQF